MDISNLEQYDMGPDPFQTREQYQNYDYLYYTTQAEHIADPTAFRSGSGLPWQPYSRPQHQFASIQTEDPLSDAQQEPTSPSLGGFPALTPSESFSTVLSDHAVGVFGENEENISVGGDGSFRDLSRLSNLSAELFMRSTSRGSKDLVSSSPGFPIHNQSAVQDGSEERLLMLREINDHSKLEFPLSAVKVLS
jgi:hypothetical protein